MLSKVQSNMHSPALVQLNRFRKEQGATPTCGYHGERTASGAAARRNRQAHAKLEKEMRRGYYPGKVYDA